MADKSTHFVDPMDFHPCDTPRGMDYYDLTCLTEVQQRRLNTHKLEVVREHQKFLYRNPEVRAILQIITRKLLIERPTHDIDKFIGSYFSNNWYSIVDEVNKYVEGVSGKPPPVTTVRSSIKAEDRHVTMDEARRSEVSFASSEESVEERLTIHIIKDVLDEVIDKVHEWVQLHPGKVQPDADEKLQEMRASDKFAEDEDEEIFLDLGLDFDLDFSGYHEEDDNKDYANVKDDDTILETLHTDNKNH